MTTQPRSCRRIRLVACALTGLLAVAQPARADKSSDFCKKARSMDKLGDALDSIDPTKDVKKAEKTMGKIVGELKKLEDKAPSIIKKDVKDVRSVLDDFKKALPTFGALDPKKPDPKKAADAAKKLQPILTRLDKMQPSMNRVTAFLDKECGIKS